MLVFPVLAFMNAYLTAYTHNSQQQKKFEQLKHVVLLAVLFCSYIKPHVDSVKFCGEVIAGISLLSPSVMRLQHESDSAKCLLVLLPQRSLYILKSVSGKGEETGCIVYSF